MASNFDFLEKIDKELYSSILDAEKLFRDEYFSQCCVQLRIFAEKTAKKVLGKIPEESTFDDIINCLKDKAKSEQEKEFIEDLFFIKKEGNKCAHGEDASSLSTLEAIRRAFEIAINYSFAKKKDEKLLRLQFDETLLITQKPLEKNPLVEKYVELANEQKEEMLKQKQEETDSSFLKPNNEIKDNEPKTYKKTARKKKELTPVQIKIKEKIKETKKNLKENINKKSEKTAKKPKKQNKNKNKNKNNSKRQKELKKFIVFIVFTIISLYFLTKLIFF